jgi:predicted HicB family RNase H-like nuclease
MLFGQDLGQQAMSNTPRRTVRIDDGLWEEARAAASDRGESLSDVIRAALFEYVNAATAQPARPNS